ncbi:MAG: hypothetical protein ABMA13_22895 [Chthoniobacteraceae bacterium]
MSDYRLSPLGVLMVKIGPENARVAMAALKAHAEVMAKAEVEAEDAALGVVRIGAITFDGPGGEFEVLEVAT